jgi:hypothetical protein
MAPAMAAAQSTLGPLTGPRGNFQLDPDRDREDARRLDHSEGADQAGHGDCWDRQLLALRNGVP